MRRRIAALLIMTVMTIPFAHADAEMATIEAGRYTPFVLRTKAKGDPEVQKKEVAVPAFQIDRDLVSNREFLEFVRKTPEWRKSNMKPLFADAHYLENWPADLEIRKGDLDKPVTRVSWFAAKAYCESLHKELPTTDQWELTFFNRGRGKKATEEQVLAWYGQPSGEHLAKRRSGGANSYGVYDLSRLVWEWTLDFNSFLASNEMRSSAANTAQFCGGSSLGAADASDYVAFMRYSFRTSLKASYTTANLGFRCAKDK